MLEPVERLDGGVVAEPDGGEGDEAEVGGGGGRPFQGYQDREVLSNFEYIQGDFFTGPHPKSSK